MASTLWNPVPSPVFDSNGEKASGALAYFFAAGTTTPYVTYSDSAQTTPRTHPVVANSIGIFPAVFIPYTDTGYRVRVLDSAGTVIADLDGIDNTAPPSAGGGAGVVVAAADIFVPGMMIWMPKSGTQDGWVRMNGRTMGNAASGATERANADTVDAYTFLHDNLSDAIAAVSTGRGASAAADYAANKTILIPSMRGRAPFGLDDMGNTAANVGQTSTTLTTTGGNVTATVTDPTFVTVGMTIVNANVPGGTTISSMSGSAITMSAAATGGAGVVAAARFSMFSDAQTVGATGGTMTKLAVIAEMPAHTHPVVDARVQTIPSGNGGAGSNSLVVAAHIDGTPNHAVAIATPSGTITTTGTGGNSAIHLQNPGRVGSYYLKL